MARGKCSRQHSHKALRAVIVKLTLQLPCNILAICILNCRIDWKLRQVKGGLQAVSRCGYLLLRVRNIFSLRNLAVSYLMINVFFFFDNFEFRQLSCTIMGFILEDM